MKKTVVLIIVGIIVLVMGVLGLIPGLDLGTEPTWHAVVKIVVGALTLFAGLKGK